MSCTQTWRFRISPPKDQEVWEVARAVLNNPDKVQSVPEVTDLAIRTMFNVFSWELRLALIDGKIEEMVGCLIEFHCERLLTLPVLDDG